LASSAVSEKGRGTSSSGVTRIMGSGLWLQFVRSVHAFEKIIGWGVV